jgi:hypothetical protein
MHNKEAMLTLEEFDNKTVERIEDEINRLGSTAPKVIELNPNLSRLEFDIPFDSLIREMSNRLLEEYPSISFTRDDFKNISNVPLESKKFIQEKYYLCHFSLNFKRAYYGLQTAAEQLEKYLNLTKRNLEKQNLDTIRIDKRYIKRLIRLYVLYRFMEIYLPDDDEVKRFIYTKDDERFLSKFHQMDEYELIDLSGFPGYSSKNVLKKEQEKIRKLLATGFKNQLKEDDARYIIANVPLMKPILGEPKDRPAGSYNVERLIIDRNPKEKTWYDVYGTNLIKGRLTSCIDCDTLLLPDPAYRKGKKCTRCHSRDYVKTDKRKKYMRDLMRKKRGS